ncbi:MAG: GMC family oxidoreductase [Nitrospiraceae bacterium]
MHIDFNLSGNNLPAMADFCVVGSGPAGMTLALELEQYGRSILLLEGGGLDWSQESQEIYRGDVIGDHYVGLEYARARLLGGTSGHWGGWSYPLNEFAFKKKEGFEDAQWPIEKKDLDPYFEKALSVLDIRPPRNEVLLDSEFGIREFRISYSRVRFGQRYRERLNASKTLTYVTNANLTGLKTDGQHVVGAHVTNFAGQSAGVKAKHFILAMGGIENSRMLLWFNHQTNGKLIDSRAPLGRYWMEHPGYKVGHALVDLKIPKTDYFIPHLLLGFTEAVIRKLSILDCSIILEEIPSKDTKGLLKDLVCVAPKVGEWAASLAGKNIVCGAKLIAGWEQEPIWSNHVKLSETKRDRFGVPMVELHWKKTDRDRVTLQKALSQFNDFLMTRNRGRIKLDEWVFGKGGYPSSADDGVSYHHMGGTRMAQTVQHGVVDSNCRVFGQGNLYVVGSSVFPSGGEANPTFTIVQLSLRLAEHLRNA